MTRILGLALVFALVCVPIFLPTVTVTATTTILCFLEGERISGLNKICYYDCAGSAAAITIKSYQLCPLTIQSE